MRLFPFIILMLLFNNTMRAQSWDWGRGSIGNDVSSWPVATDKAGNVFVSGTSSGSVSMNNHLPPFSAGGNLGLLAKYTGNGTFLWVRNADNGTSTYPVDIATDSAGNCYMLGCSADAEVKMGGVVLRNERYPQVQYFIARFSAQGDVLWIRYAGSRAGLLPAHAIGLSYGSAVTIRRQGGIATAEGNVYVALPFNVAEVTVGATTVANKNQLEATEDILLAGFDTSGNALWAKGVGGNGSEIPGGLAASASGSIYIAGVFNSDNMAVATSLLIGSSTAADPWNAFIACFASDGVAKWAGCSYSTGNTYATGVSASANEVYLIGGSGDNYISVAGSAIAAPHPGYAYLYLLQINATGTVNWRKAIGSAMGTTHGYSVAARDHVYICGYFNDALPIDGKRIDVPGGSVDPIFIGVFTASGGYIGGGALQSGGTSQAGIACDAARAAFVCSDYRYPVAPFMIGENVLATVHKDQSWLYVGKFVFKSGIGGGGSDNRNRRRDTLVCLDVGAVRLAAPEGYTYFTWNTGETDSVISVTQSGVYWVKAMNATDAAIVDTMAVLIREDCNCEPFMANGFTPNGDGKNDTYGPAFEQGCTVSKYAFTVYNRWGERVFRTENPWERWNGTYKNVEAELGVYMYYLIYQVDPRYPQKYKKGDLTVVR